VRFLRALLVLAACSRQPQPAATGTPPLLPTEARSTSDSVVAAVLHTVVVHGLPIFHAGKRTVVIRDDSGFVSSSSLPRIDSVAFTVLDSAGIQDLANRVGQLNVVRIWRPVIGSDTARSGAYNRYVWGQAVPDGQRQMIISVCSYRLRRISGVWQLDSILGCGVS
jgi:hypothetical protein